MRIGNCKGTGQIEPESPKPQGVSGAFNTDFRDLLQKEVDDAGRPSSDGHMPLEMKAAMGSVSPLSSLNPPELNGMGVGPLPEINHLEGILNTLSKRLEKGPADPAVIEDSLRSISLESEALSSLVSRGGFDPSLNQLEQDLSVLSYVESIKWRRGDFV